MQAWRYPEMIELILAGKLSPHKMIGKTIALEEASAALVGMDSESHAGITIIDRF